MSREASGTGARRTIPSERDGFIQRVAARESADEPVAAYHARVVLELLDEATQGQVSGKVRDLLPEDLRPLVDAGGTGRMQT